mmetsp:Transcript_29215/g.80266  ORF Transcript_29215/g.80266 Transcript_29215/m.80266 type:complete len:257 (-) Transcript_29215:72-842(-)|eukprot:CAMPEP_0168728176 /NCGR_PEP_ID=MMETSP0724-20121128/5549_1 /TAXON_ID=265536 /ORGANISM="Amphiprora sp., Strain CCMP467" /LENGTH=256 /DNA_ID=CAMNT_0008775013 /DNA_START=58 /DNA_END=828 /DNA_ORIENTATION=+
MSGTQPPLRALGFCGADDSVDPRLLGLIAHAYPIVEFGVLFRPDKEGQPRYATAAWAEKFGRVVRASKIKAAAHLCGARVNQVLDGDSGFLSQLESWGFGRVQINATAVNGVDTSKLDEQAPNLLSLAEKLPTLEFILQKNEETAPLWEAILKIGIPKNMSMLVDESKGTGVAAKSWPSPPTGYEIGYAGGIGPSNIDKVLSDVMEAANGRSIWIDMESSLRSTKNGKDVFDLDKCFLVINAACNAGHMKHPARLG